MFSPTMDLRFPAGGDVKMDYQPRTNWGRVSAQAGNQEIEAVIFWDLALPGRQLGKLIDAVGVLIALARRADPSVFDRLPEKERDAIDDLETPAGLVEEKKTELADKGRTKPARCSIVSEEPTRMSTGSSSLPGTNRWLTKPSACSQSAARRRVSIRITSLPASRFGSGKGQARRRRVGANPPPPRDGCGDGQICPSLDIVLNY